MGGHETVTISATVYLRDVSGVRQDRREHIADFQERGSHNELTLSPGQLIELLRLLFDQLETHAALEDVSIRLLDGFEGDGTTEIPAGGGAPES